MWMFIEKELCTGSGLECNKIGVSYSAFRNEEGKCGKPIGSCIRNQIEDYVQADLQRIQVGQSPNYFISSKVSVFFSALFSFLGKF